MAKDLPYFQFEPAEYLAGSIQFCTLEAQGLFANIQAIYWQRECELTVEQVNNRFGKPDLVLELTKNKIIKVKEGNITIKFLQSQFIAAKAQSEKNRINGKKGALVKYSKSDKLHSPPIAPLDSGYSETLGNKRKERKVIDNKQTRAGGFVEYVNSTFNRKFQLTKTVKEKFNARITTGQYKSEVLVQVVQNVKQSTFHINNNFGYVTPEYLLREETIEKFKSIPVVNKQTTSTTEPLNGQQYAPETDLYTDFK